MITEKNAMKKPHPTQSRESRHMQDNLEEKHAKEKETHLTADSGVALFVHFIYRCLNVG